MSAFGNAINPIINNIVYPVVEIMFGVAVFVFVWGVLQIVIGGDDEDKRKAGKLTMVWGTVGLFIMVSAWGIVYFISNTLKSF